MLHELLHGASKRRADLHVRLCPKIGGLRAHDVQHGSTAVGAKELAALCRLLGGRKHDHVLPTPMPGVRDEEAAGSNPVTPTHLCRSAACASASRARSCCNITCRAWRMTSVESDALSLDGPAREVRLLADHRDATGIPRCPLSCRLT
jgi:hypothetical protein